jgi:hypothetical protein
MSTTAAFSKKSSYSMQSYADRLLSQHGFGPDGEPKKKSKPVAQHFFEARLIRVPMGGKVRK